MIERAPFKQFWSLCKLHDIETYRYLLDKFHFHISNSFFHISRLKKHSVVSYPRHWPIDVAEGSVVKIPVPDEIFEELKLCFQASIQKSVWIDNIKRFVIRTFLTDMKGLSAFFLGIYKVILFAVEINCFILFYSFESMLLYKKTLIYHCLT